MSSTHDLDDRLVAFYASELPTRAPDRVLVDALTRIESTPQRRVLALAPWRFRPMNVYTRLAAATVAVVAIAAFAAIALQPNPGLTGASSSPTRTSLTSSVPGTAPTPSATPGPTVVAAIPLPVGSGVALAPGRYVVPVRGANWSVELTIPGAGWLTSYLRLSPPGSTYSSISFGTVTSVFANACVEAPAGETPSAIGPSVHDLVSALDVQTGTDMEERSTSTVGGYPSAGIVMRPSQGIEKTCGSKQLALWRSEGPGFVEQVGINTTSAPGEEFFFWIVDVDGSRVVITTPDPSQSALIQELFDSIEFVRP